MLESFKTDDLLADLQNIKAQIDEMTASYGILYDAYRQVAGDLDIMEAKLAFVGGVMRQTMDLVLPQSEDVEQDAMSLLFADDSALGITKNVLWLTTAPLAVTMIAEFAVFSKLASGTGKVAKFAKATKFMKIVRFGKFAGPVALALEAVMFIWTEAQSKMVNEDLREVIEEAKQAKKQADLEIKKLQAALASAKQQRQGMLQEAGVNSVEAYVEKLNLAIVDLGRRKVAMDVGRRMLRAGMKKDDILSFVDGMSVPLLDSLEKRLKAEVLLAGGSTPAQITQQTGLTGQQLAEVSTVIDARDAYVRGQDEEALLAATGIAQGTYDAIEDRLDTELAQAWPEIEGALPLDMLANKLLVRPAALDDLRRELRAKTRLSAREDIGTIATALSIDRAHIVAWASDLPVQSETARNLKQAAQMSEWEMASQCRLPMSLVQSA